MKFVHELRRYQMLMNAFYRATDAANAWHDTDIDRACDYDDRSESLIEKAKEVEASMRAFVRAQPVGETRMTQRKIFRLAQRLTGIRA